MKARSRHGHIVLNCTVLYCTVLYSPLAALIVREDQPRLHARPYTLPVATGLAGPSVGEADVTLSGAGSTGVLGHLHQANGSDVMRIVVQSGPVMVQDHLKLDTISDKNVYLI